MFIEQILGVLMLSFLSEKTHEKKYMKTQHRRFSHLSLWRSCIHGLCFFTSPLMGLSLSLSLTHTHLPRSSIEEKPWISCFREFVPVFFVCPRHICSTNHQCSNSSLTPRGTDFSTTFLLRCKTVRSINALFRIFPFKLQSLSREINHCPGGSKLTS
jgi:hypothetical protein